jgi:predicted DNA-binding transcriptional regulator YafY
MSHGEGLEVLSPAELRETLIRKFEIIRNKYD